MGVSYKKLFLLLLQKDLKRKDLKEMTSLSSATMEKLSSDKYVSLEILVKICCALNVELGDIVEITNDYTDAL